MATRWHIIAHIILVGLGILFALPFTWLISTSLKVDSKIFAENTELVPRAPFVVVTDEVLSEHARVAAQTAASPGTVGAGLKPAPTDREQAEALGTGQIREEAAPLPSPGETVRVRPLKQQGDYTLVQVYRGVRVSKEQFWVKEGAIQDKFFLNWHNYSEALKDFDFTLYLKNTLRICVLTVFGTVMSCSLVAYGLACVKWKGRELLFWLMLSTMMLPGQVTMIPVFLTFKKLGWIGSILPLVVPSFLGNAFFIFLLRQFYRTIPTELAEAARIDGCSELGIWWRIMFPLSKPALAVVGLFTFIGTWNDFLGPLIYLIDDRQYTLSIGLAMFQGQYGGFWGQMMAVSTMMVLPIVILFFFTQKTFIQGVKLSGIKG
ncbi:MAG TPA: carbohydrate ABC transporter permease [Candidatus Brocadiia bacterium]|nr:carbohydrate ABC transporter permease [Candidatus Brocadiia bacterium]